ncbi:MAG: threonyl-tRNA synthetase editing domain-containing protein [candidate division Zixibacteria bacterium]|nr:threonyl-tRNA synthetase editing domain-containing protein [candidate division Zixibacteria bacterium]
MKLLMIYMNKFSFCPTIKTIESMPDFSEEKKYENIQAAFIQVEKKDEENETLVKRKLLKNLKWIAGKNNTNKIILHSFAHLSESKAEPEFTKLLFDNIDERLKNSGFEVEQTPFGYFLDLKIDAPGYSLARVFKDL